MFGSNENGITDRAQASAIIRWLSRQCESQWNLTLIHVDPPKGLSDSSNLEALFVRCPRIPHRRGFARRVKMSHLSQELYPGAETGRQIPVHTPTDIGQTQAKLLRADPPDCGLRFLCYPRHTSHCRSMVCAGAGRARFRNRITAPWSLGPLHL
jgi:hypothetical protein